MASDPSAVTTLTLTGDPVVEEARKFFDRCAEWESTWRRKFIDDVKFANGDSDNGWQWPIDKFNDRTRQARPCLTINMVNQHNKMISNEAKKNKSSVKFLALGNGATSESAKVFQDIMRHIEHQSQAQTAYSIARDFQIGGGKGWFRLVTDWVEGTMEQEIYVASVNDPLSVYMDPDCKKRNKSDSKKALVFDDVPLEDFYQAYPKFKDSVADTPLGVGSMDSNWQSKDHVRIAEYFRKVPKEHELVSFVNGGKRHQLRRDKLARMISDRAKLRLVLDDPQTRIRDMVEWEIEWKLIVGQRVVDETVWPGRFIPLIPVLGDESVIDGLYDCKGHTRWMKDAQRMFNFNASAQVEFVALQGKTPWIVPVKAIEELEQFWNTANVTNHSVLPYNHVDSEGNVEVPIPPPQRTEPPNFSPAYQTGMDTALQQIMLASGQFQNQMGMGGNERTGEAIQQRQMQSDTAIFHFQDSYEEALILLGQMVIDLVPKVYDTKRVRRIQADDGVDYDLEIDPTQRESYLQEVAHNGEVVKRIFNPNVGRYDIAASVGPAYGSKREETQQALTLILTQAPGLVGIIGDLLLSSMDFDKAQEAAQRLKRMVPPIAMGQGPSQAEQQLQSQLSAATQGLVKALDKNAKDQIKLAGKDELREVEVYDAETKRMAALGKLLPTDPNGLREMISQLVKDSMQTHIKDISDQTEKDAKAQSVPEPEPPSPVPGAQRAGDGEWYISDPTRRGKYLRIAPLAQEHSRPGIIAGGSGG